jgi:hypothetical protein
LPDDAFKSGDLAFVDSLQPNGHYELIRTTAAAPPGAIAAFSGNGYWLPLMGSFTSVANLAALAAYPDAGLPVGALVYVQTLRSYFQKGSLASIPTSTATEVPCASGTGTWYRLPVTSITWEAQADWYINPSTGDDESDGSSATPLKTWAEFARRVQAIDIAMTVTVVGNLTEPLRGTFQTTVSTASLTITGTPTVVATGSSTTFSNPIPASNTRGIVTATLVNASTGLPDTFVNYVSKIVRAYTSGRATYWPVLYSTLANTAEGPFWAQKYGANTHDLPANGTAIEVLELPTVPTVCIVTNGGLPVLVSYFRFTSLLAVDVPALCTNGVTASVANTALGVEVTLGFVACSFSTFGINGCRNFIGCVIPRVGSLAAQIRPGFAGGGEGTNFIGGGCLRNLDIVTNSIVNFQGFIVQGGQLTVGATITGNNFNAAGAIASSLTASVPLGVFNSPATGVFIVGATFNFRALYGSGNAAYGVRIESGGTFRATISPSAALTPTITGTAGDFLFNATPNVIPPLTAGAVVPAAVAFTTWAAWDAAPFSRTALAYNDGTRCIAS